MELIKLFSTLENLRLRKKRFVLDHLLLDDMYYIKKGKIYSRITCTTSTITEIILLSDVYRRLIDNLISHHYFISYFKFSPIEKELSNPKKVIGFINYLIVSHLKGDTYSKNKYGKFVWVKLSTITSLLELESVIRKILRLAVTLENMFAYTNIKNRILYGVQDIGYIPHSKYNYEVTLYDGAEYGRTAIANMKRNYIEVTQKKNKLFILPTGDVSMFSNIDKMSDAIYTIPDNIRQYVDLDYIYSFKKVYVIEAIYKLLLQKFPQIAYNPNINIVPYFSFKNKEYTIAPSSSASDNLLNITRYVNDKIPASFDGNLYTIKRLLDNFGQQNVNKCLKVYLLQKYMCLSKTNKKLNVIEFLMFKYYYYPAEFTICIEIGAEPVLKKVGDVAFHPRFERKVASEEFLNYLDGKISRIPKGHNLLIQDSTIDRLHLNKMYNEYLKLAVTYYLIVNGIELEVPKEDEAERFKLYSTSFSSSKQLSKIYKQLEHVQDKIPKPSNEGGYTSVTEHIITTGYTTNVTENVVTVTGNVGFRTTDPTGYTYTPDFYDTTSNNT